MSSNQGPTSNLPMDPRGDSPRSHGPTPSPLHTRLSRPPRERSASPGAPPIPPRRRISQTPTRSIHHYDHAGFNNTSSQQLWAGQVAYNNSTNSHGSYGREFNATGANGVGSPRGRPGLDSNRGTDSNYSPAIPPRAMSLDRYGNSHQRPVHHLVNQVSIGANTNRSNSPHAPQHHITQNRHTNSFDNSFDASFNSTHPESHVAAKTIQNLNNAQKSQMLPQKIESPGLPTQTSSRQITLQNGDARSPDNRRSSGYGSNSSRTGHDKGQCNVLRKNDQANTASDRGPSVRNSTEVQISSPRTRNSFGEAGNKSSQILSPPQTFHSVINISPNAQMHTHARGSVTSPNNVSHSQPPRPQSDMSNRQGNFGGSGSKFSGGQETQSFKGALPPQRPTLNLTSRQIKMSEQSKAVNNNSSKTYDTQTSTPQRQEFIPNQNLFQASNNSRPGTPKRPSLDIASRQSVPATQSHNNELLSQSARFHDNHQSVYHGQQNQAPSPGGHRVAMVINPSSARDTSSPHNRTSVTSTANIQRMDKDFNPVQQNSSIPINQLRDVNISGNFNLTSPPHAHNNMHNSREINPPNSIDGFKPQMHEFNAPQSTASFTNQAANWSYETSSGSITPQRCITPSGLDSPRRTPSTSSSTSGKWDQHGRSTTNHNSPDNSYNSPQRTPNFTTGGGNMGIDSPKRQVTSQRGDTGNGRGLQLPVQSPPQRLHGSASVGEMHFTSPDSPGGRSLPGGRFMSPSTPSPLSLPDRYGAGGGGSAWNTPSDSSPHQLYLSSPGSGMSSPGSRHGSLSRQSSAGTPTSLWGSMGGGSGRRRKDFVLPMSPSQPPVPDAAEIDQKYQEIMKRSGILNIDGQTIQTSIGNLEHLGELGHGTCGHVVKMRHQHTGKIMAVKQMRRSGNRDENKRIIMDLDVVIKSHSCPFIVHCIGTFITTSDVWICMELMCTCLEKLLKAYKHPFPEVILGKVAVATVKALHYLKEEHGVIHRDVKPSNILLDEKGRIKLCDFGISGRLVDSKARTRSAGCAAYMAPERIDPPDQSKPEYDIRADVWALGISLVELATGSFPYKNCTTDFELLTRVLEEDPPVLVPSKDFSVEFCSFVSHCLTKDYLRRPKYKQLLNHTFIKKYSPDTVDVAAWYAHVTAIINKSQTSK